MAANKYPSPCHKCRVAVAAYAGEVARVGEKWLTTCRICAGGSAIAAPRKAGPASIRIEFNADAWLTFDTQNLNADQFLAARSALDGVQRNGTALPKARVEIGVYIVARLRQLIGVVIDILPSAAAAMQAYKSSQAAALDAATGRAATVNTLLQAQGLALFGFQSFGVGWLAPREGAILADDMGLGKTIQVLAAAPVGAPVVIVCPAVAKGVWLREASRWRPDLKPIVLAGLRSFRWPRAGEMIVVNYDILSIDRASCDACEGTGEVIAIDKKTHAEKKKPCKCIALPAAPLGCIIVADEAHALKNAKAQRTGAFRGLVERVRIAGGKTWLVTATPLINRPAELWTLLCLISRAKQCFGSWSSFVDTFGGIKDRYHVIQWGARPVKTALVADRLRDVMLRRMKVDVIKDLPAKTIEIVDVELDTSAIGDLNKIRAELAAAGIDLDKAMAAARGNTSTEIGAIARARSILAMAKTPAALQLIDEAEENNEPVVVFSSHRAPVDMLGRRPGWATITGDTSPEERTRISDAFQRGEYKGIAGTIKAMGVAITLTRACMAIIIDPDWAPPWNVQAEDRIYRIGQPNAVRIYYLRADHPIDEAVFTCLGIKRALIAASVDAAIVDAEGKVAAYGELNMAHDLAEQAAEQAKAKGLAS